jgi:acetylornithine/succinyldiaminopimelate/putrescine aminotransferase
MAPSSIPGGAAVAVPVQPFASAEETMSAFAAHLSAGKVELYRQLGLELVMGRREGVRFWDAYSDRCWINCHCNGGVFNLGHRHPRLVAALRQALDGLDVGNHHLVSGFRAALAGRLAATTGGRLPGVVFAPGGGEVIDVAIKAARGATGRQRVVSARGGYHGHTGLALAAGDAEYREPFGPNLPGFVQVPFGDLDAVAAVVDHDTAAVLLEPIPATLGMPLPPDGYLRSVQDLCREWGARLVVDEVQTGLGRTGSMWFAHPEGLEPDALVTGKGLGGGLYPMAAVLLSAELGEVFHRHPFVHIATFGGAELGCVVALAVLDLIEEEGFLERVRELSERFGEAFAGLPFELRRRGLMMGLAFPDEAAAMAAAAALFEHGVFVVWANNDRRALQFLPPLVLTDDEAEELIDRVTGALT